LIKGEGTRYRFRKGGRWKSRQETEDRKFKQEKRDENRR